MIQPLAILIIWVFCLSNYWFLIAILNFAAICASAILNVKIDFLALYYI